MTIIGQDRLTLSIEPNYSLTEEQGLFTVSETVNQVVDHIDISATNVLIAGGDTPLANYVRSVEARALPTIPKVMEDYEDTSKFVVVLQDMDEDGVMPETPAHVFRVNSIEVPDSAQNDKVGLPTFDDVLKMGLVTEQELLDFYQVDSLSELGTRYINVESNIAIEGVKQSIRKPYSALGYRALFELVQYEQKRGVVAYQNPEAMRSLGHLGLISMPLVGNPNLSIVNEDKSPTHNEDERYFPLTVETEPWSRLNDGTPQHNGKIFTDPAYAQSHSRIAALVAQKPLNVINIL